MDYVNQIKKELNELANREKGDFLLKYFKAYPGGYGEGDQFLGVKVPDQRKIARKYYKNIPLEELQDLLQENIHEYRQTALFILVNKYEKSKTEETKNSLVQFYLKNISYVNNWDLVDATADKILGAYLIDKNKDILYDFASSNQLWKQRIAIISTLYFVRKNEFQDSLNIAEILVNHEHDLIHKAVGWTLREIGKRDYFAEYNFLKKHYQTMPRTMLRYAIEKFSPEIRKKFLQGLI